MQNALSNFFSMLPRTGSKFERIYRNTHCFPSLIPAKTDAKTLKRNGFENQSEWSKTCELNAICFRIPQETRT